MIQELYLYLENFIYFNTDKKGHKIKEEKVSSIS